QDHDQVRLLHGLGHGEHAQALCLGLCGGLGAGAQADADVDAGVTQAERVGVPLRAVADDGDLATLDDREVGVGIVEHLCHLLVFLLVAVWHPRGGKGAVPPWVYLDLVSAMVRAPRPRATCPDWTSSWMPWGESIS